MIARHWRGWPSVNAPKPISNTSAPRRSRPWHGCRAFSASILRRRVSEGEDPRVRRRGRRKRGRARHRSGDDGDIRADRSPLRGGNVSAGYRIRPARVEMWTCSSRSRSRRNDAEGVSLDAAAVRRGVCARSRTRRLPATGLRWTAGRPSPAPRLPPRSNFYGAHYWWVQSLFVSARHTAAGPCRPAAGPPGPTAASAGALDLRLYAHEDNARAHRLSPVRLHQGTLPP